MLGNLGNRLRGLLRIRKARALPRGRAAKPSVGAAIVQGDLRILVQAGMSDELWRWLHEQGWRESTFQPDRRRYRDVPSQWVARLIDASPGSYERVLQAGLAQAAMRPAAVRSAGAGARPRGR